MRFIAIAEDELLFEMMGITVSEEDDSVIYLTGDANLRKRIARKGGEALSGDLFSKRIYERAGLDDDSFVVVNVDDPQKLRRAAQALREAAPSAPIVVIETIPGHLDQETLREEIPDLEVLPLHIPFHDALAKELQFAASRKRVAHYKADFALADKVLILLHDEPDPDSIGSALALRAILGRDRRTAIIATLGTFSRPENVRMAQLLDIDVVSIGPEDLPAFQRIALVDAQPNLFGEHVPEADLVIDHHPLRKDYKARFQDVRPSCGATATIMTEHLQAAGVTISERLATALLYAIKSDTLFLQRGASQADVEAFTLHYRQADPATVRRIEGAGASTARLKYLAKAMRNMRMEGGLCYAHLGRVEREDFVPWLAEFFIDLEEVEWSAVSGTLQGELVISVRNLGYQRAAGTLTKNTFEQFGKAGGRRAAAKAVLPMKAVRKEAGSGREADVSAWVWKRLRSGIGA